MSKEKRTETHTRTEEAPYETVGRDFARRCVPRVTTVNDQPSMTQQHHLDKVNINKLMARYRKTGHLEHVKQGQPLYGDFTHAGDLQTAFELVEEAAEKFEALPVEIRTAAANDPVRLVEMLETDEGREALRSAYAPLEAAEEAGTRARLQNEPVGDPPASGADSGTAPDA